MKSAVFAIAAALILSSAAVAQDIIEIDRTPRGDQFRRLTPQEAKAQAAGEWAQKVLDRAATGQPAGDDDDEADEVASRCIPNDGVAHGEVWVEAGTGGYHSVGGVVTQPIGKCGQLTIGIDQTDFGGQRRLRAK